MASIIPTFEYDIFISYRHNDNRSGWVAEFVKALQEELAATIKAPVSVYFDTNPHDGLLETHNVDKSLEGKLKCLIFIPIISQTYCDTKSFAWQHEFVAFNRMAIEGAPLSPGEGKGVRPELGRDIKLSNGNVASRILPIKIHGLDSEDKALLENELGGVLRAIDFIYKESGVNRPLKSSDNKNDNQNKTDYRNQVNKVANAIKEIITALKNPIAQSPRAITNVQSSTNPSRNKKSLVAVISLILLLSIGGYFLYPKLFSSSKEVDVLDKSIAVLPFENMSGDPEQEYFSDGITEEILNSLAQIEGLKVTGRTSSFQFKGKEVDLKEVGEKLGVATILEGSIRKQNDQLRITVQLVSAKDGYHLWSQRFDRKVTDVFAIQDEIAQAVSSKLKVTFLSESTDGRPKANVQNQEAYEFYLKGRFFLNMRGTGMLKGLEFFKQAVALDSTFALAYEGLASCYAVLSFYQMIPSLAAIRESKKWAMKAIELEPNSSGAYAALGFVAHWLERDWDRAEQMFQKSLAISPNNAPFRANYASYLLNISGEPIESEKQSMIAVQLDPLFLVPYINVGNALVEQGKYDLAKQSYQKALELNDNSTLPFTSLSQLLLIVKKPGEAIELLKTNMGVTGRSQLMLAALCEAYAEAGKTEPALKVYKEIQEMARTGYVAPFTLGRAALAVGKLDQAFKYYDQALEEKNNGFATWNLSIFKKLKFKAAFMNDQRYKYIMERLAFPEN